MTEQQNQGMKQGTTGLPGFLRRTAMLWPVGAYLLLVPWVHDGFWLHLVSLTLVFGLFAMSLDLLVGYTGMVSFGHAAFMGAGAYVTGILMTLELTSIYLVLPVTLLASGLLAAVIGRLSLGTSGASFIMITLALSNWCISWP